MGDVAKYLDLFGIHLSAAQQFRGHFYGRQRVAQVMTDNPDQLLGEQGPVFSRSVRDTQLVLGHVLYALVLEVFRQMPFGKHSGIEQFALVPLAIRGLE
ncbi:hypothetical protein D9M71_438490 [compost metagenome]